MFSIVFFLSTCDPCLLKPLMPISCYVRCSEYAILILEYWADAPEIQRASDIYEDLIKCCVADAMSEVGLTPSIFPDLSHHNVQY